ncbi:pro-interleukin-16, partial [Nephila pilipes]
MWYILCPFSAKQGVESWNNEPRNRRGADFSRSDWSSRTSSYAAKTSVSDIRRSFENGTKEAEQPPLPKKTVPVP